MNDPSNGQEVRVGFMTCPDEACAARIIGSLLDERLIACGNLVSGVRSIYRWRGTIEDAEECLVVIKTRIALVERVADRIKELHPYDEPEFLTVPVENGLPGYLSWVVEETRGQS